MTNPAAHTLLDQLLNEVKQNLVDDHIDKMKTDILNVVAKKQENFLQDMVQICDSISRDTVDATMNAAAQMIQNEKQEMLDFIRAMVQKEVSIEVEKLKMAVENETRYLRSVSAKMTATYRASIHSFMKKDPKREKHDSK